MDGRYIARGFDSIYRSFASRDGRLQVACHRVHKALEFLASRKSHTPHQLCALKPPREPPPRGLTTGSLCARYSIQCTLQLLLKLKFLEGVQSKLSLDALSRPRIIIEYPETGGSGFWGKL